MYVFFFLVGGLIGAYWVWGMSQFPENKPLVFWKPTGKYGILIVAVVLILIGFFLLYS
jgi:hypothetical protein